ncbi:MAG: putative sulfate exporter family transporter [Bacteroidaceae bacterium]|nr:putative sulfate exporter family transporter [Bacteroidaceae bacterium]
MKKENVAKILFILLLVASFFLTPAIALFLGILLSLTIGVPYSKLTKKLSKYLLQISVVGLGFGMNLHQSLQAGKEGMIFTIISVIGVMILGAFLGKLLKINRKNSYLISSGTAICGGSAIAAVAPVIDADENDTSLALITIFVLNAIALFIFPPIGRALDLSQVQFGTWAAIAIHDTSSVVGAGAAYGDEALKVATTIKLTRALWIIPLAFVSAFIFKTKGRKASIPYFIIWFVVAMLINTYFALPQIITTNIVFVAKKLLTVTLFLIGCGLSVSALKAVGVKPLLLGVILWVIISVVTLFVVML